MRITRSLAVRTRIVLMSGLSSLSLLIAYFAMSGIIALPFTSQTHAITPPDSCFAFDSATGTITSYYDNEGDNTANPTCPRAVDIPSSIGGIAVTVIGDVAFYNNQLTSVIIPTGVITIGSSAFSNNKITSVTIPTGTTTIDQNAFTYNRLTSVTIPNSVTTINSNAFSGNDLTTVTIPSSVTTMSHDSFTDNPLSSMTIGSITYAEQTPTTNSACFALSGSTVTDYYQASPIVARDAGVLCGRNVVIPSNVTIIGDGAFADNGLTVVSIPNGVTSIGRWGFSNNQLTSVTLPSGLTSMSDRSFYSNKLTSITIPAGVTSIGDCAFYANSLTSIILPSSIIDIKPTAFFAQNPWGGDMDYYGRNGAPDLWSSNPAEVQRAYDSIWYVRVYTADPSNPNHITNSVIDEDWWSGDLNANNINDSLGGHLINPAPVTLDFTDNHGTALRPSETFTGKLSNGTVLSDYLVTKGPIIPMPANAANPTLAEQAAINEALSAYYRISDTFTYAAPLINGITPTPVSYSFVLGATNEVNTKTFVYTAATVPTSSNTNGSLANTGLSMTNMILLGIGIITISLGIVIRQRRSAS